jgi:hypothetical protein
MRELALIILILLRYMVIGGRVTCPRLVDVTQQRASTRYRQADIACTITPIDRDTIEVIFDSPQKAVTPGQSAVFYVGDVCLGGAIIDSYRVLATQLPTHAESAK